MARAEFGIVITNWNGREVIEPCLRSVRVALREAGLNAGVCVVDDASSDDSTTHIAAHFPEVRVLALERNVGFGAAANRGIGTVEADWIFLLNNDLALRPDFFSRLIEARERIGDPALFAVAAQTLDWNETRPSHTGMRLGFERGLLVQSPFHPAALAGVDLFQAGACLLHRGRFIALGGFAPLYHPAYWEDYDLALKARRAGWMNYYEPAAVAWHKGKHSMRTQFGAAGVSHLIRRNQLLFTWAHLDSATLLARHAAEFPRRVAAPRELLYEGDPAAWVRAWADASRRLPDVLRERRRFARSSAVSLQKILDEARAAERPAEQSNAPLRPGQETERALTAPASLPPG